MAKYGDYRELAKNVLYTLINTAEVQSDKNEIGKLWTGTPVGSSEPHIYRVIDADKVTYGISDDLVNVLTNAGISGYAIEPDKVAWEVAKSDVCLEFMASLKVKIQLLRRALDAIRENGLD